MRAASGLLPLRARSSLKMLPASAAARAPPTGSCRAGACSSISSTCRRRAQVAAAAARPEGSQAGTATKGASAPVYLLCELNGFDPAKACAAWPALRSLSMDEGSVALAAFEAVRRLVPARIQGQLFTNHPRLLEADMEAWLSFLLSFGFEEAQVGDVLRSNPETFYLSNVFAAGQLLLFLRQNLRLAEDVVVRTAFKWAAALAPGATQAGMAAAAECLKQRLGLQDGQLLPALQEFPEVLGWSVEGELLPRLDFFESLGPAARRQLPTLYDEESGWLPGLRSWPYSVAPKLELLAGLLGSEDAARQLLASCPGVLKLPVDTKLQPVLAALSGAGLDGRQVAQLLQQCPKLLGEPCEAVVGRINFLVDVVGAPVEDLLAFPQYCTLSLADVIGPRYYFLARTRWLELLSDEPTGVLQLQRALGADLQSFLADVAASAGQPLPSVAAEYGKLAAEWDALLGWCCDKAFGGLDPQQQGAGGGGPYEEQLNLFYVLVQ